MNGAGKTSILDADRGRRAAGRSGDDPVYEGESIGGLPAHAVVARGIVQVPEGRLIFGTLSVEENLQRGRPPSRPDSCCGAATGPNLRRLFPALCGQAGSAGRRA